jgi:hypothetical protein
MKQPTFTAALTGFDEKIRFSNSFFHFTPQRGNIDLYQVDSVANVSGRLQQNFA